MKYIYCFILFFILANSSIAQNYSIQGKVMSNEGALSNSIIKLKTNKGVVKSAISDMNGEFVLTEVNQGNYKLEILAFSFTTLEQEIIIKNDTVLNNLILKDTLNYLNEIVIKLPKKTITQTDRGVVMNVSDTKFKNQPNLISILNYAPNISTNDGIKIFESNDILIQLDGKDINIDKTNISNFLETLNPKIVKTIEIIDVVDSSLEGNKSGLIKITTINKSGWNGNIRQNYLNNRKSGYSTDASIFYKKNDLRFFGNYYYSRHNTFINGHSSQINKDDMLLYNNTMKSSLKRKNDYLTIGVDYDLSENSSLSFLYMYENDKDEDHISLRTSEIENVLFSSDSLIRSKTHFDQINKMHSFSLAFNSKLDSLGSNFNLVLDLAKKKYSNPFYQYNNYENTITILDDINYQNTTSDNYIYSFKASLNKKIGKKELLIGTKLSLVKNKDSYRYYNIQHDTWNENNKYSNDFSHKEYISSIYGTFSFAVNEISKISIGLRAEYNYNKFTNNITSSNNNIKILPSIYYKTKLWKNNFYISVIQRLTRPNYSLFNPTYIKDSPISSNRGNENLVPIVTYRFQTGYSLKSNLKIDLRYNYTENSVILFPQNIDGVFLTTPKNVGYRNDIYMFLSFPYKISSWWETNSKLTTGYFDFKLPKQKFTSLYSSFSINNTFNLPFDIGLYLNYSLTSKYKNLYNTNKFTNTVNINLSYPISNVFNLNMGVNDIFNSIRNNHYYDFNSIVNTSYSKSNTRSFYISINYSFTKGKEVDDDIRDTDLEEVKMRY